MRNFNYYFIASAISLAVVVLSACRTLPAAPPVTASEPGLEGLWAADGYGYVIEIEGEQLQFYEVSSVSCIPTLSGELQSGDAESDEDAGLEALAQIPMGDLELRMQVLASASPDEKRFHVEGTASSVIARRISELPTNCEAAQPDTAEATFDVLWQTYFEHYPFFAMKEVDWEAVRREYRPQVTADTTDEELFEILQRMIEPLQDAHTFLYAPSLENGWFEGKRLDPNPLTGEDQARSAEIVETEYLRSPLQQWLNEQVAFAMLDGEVGYLRISSFIGYTDDGDFQAEHEALEAALDEIFDESENLKGLVIDIRLNDGGWDGHGLAIASRLTKSEYLAYSKQARNDPTDPDHWTIPQPSLVRPSSRPGYLGPVVLLTGRDSISGAETFTMALGGRTPEVIRIGENTQGVFSDVPFRTLPNGWLFGVPNERYLTEGGQSFDGHGIPPDIAVPVFPPSDLESGTDGALEKALELLQR
jgi:hypothetical protein